MEQLRSNLYFMVDFSLKVGKAVPELSYLSSAPHLPGLLKGWMFLPFHDRTAITASILKSNPSIEKKSNQSVL